VVRLFLETLEGSIATSSQNSLADGKPKSMCPTAMRVSLREQLISTLRGHECCVWSAVASDQDGSA
jgi:hypothetical protein